MPVPFVSRSSRSEPVMPSALDRAWMPCATSTSGLCFRSGRAPLAMPVATLVVSIATPSGPWAGTVAAIVETRSSCEMPAFAARLDIVDPPSRAFFSASGSMPSLAATAFMVFSGPPP